MSRAKLIIGLLLMAVLGLLARPWVDAWIPGQMQKNMPDLGGIYERAAMHESPSRNPVIVVPGMMGSRLQQRSTGRTIWGAFTKTSIDPSNPEDLRLIACPIDSESDLDRFDDGVSAVGVLDTLKIELAGLSLNHQAYLNILRMLGVGGFRDEELGLAKAIDYGEEHYTCFQFPYDWRRDNAENARRLHQFILEKKAYVEAARLKKYGSKEPVRFDIVAHSMGGLVSRYYLRYGDQGPAVDGNLPELNWSGCQHVDRLIMIGTPNSGSAKSLISIHEGFSFSFLLTKYPSGLVATLPSIYQLLPHGPDSTVFDSETGQALDLFDIETWDQRGWGLLNPKQDSTLRQLLPQVISEENRRALARSHVQACLARAKALHKALNLPATPPPTTSIHLFAGDAIPTVTTLESQLQNQTLSERSRSPGDATVTRKSALADQRTESNWSPTIQTPIFFDDVRFLFDDHFGLTRDPEFTDNVLFLLLEDPTKQPRTATIEGTFKAINGPAANEAKESAN